MTFDLVKAQNALTPKQRKFVELWLVHRNAHYAYVEAYEANRMNPATAYRNGHALLRHNKIAPIIEARLAALGEKLTEETELTVARVVEEYIALTFADPDEVTGLRVGACRHCWGDGHQYQWKEHEYVAELAKGGEVLPDPAGGFGYRFTDAPNPACPVCEGGGSTYQRPVDTSKLSPGGRALFAGVKPTANGLEIKLRDRDKALENAAKIIGAFTQRLDIQVTTPVKIEDVTPETAGNVYKEMIK